MSTLVVVNYNDPDNAEEVRLKLQSEYLLDLEDAVSLSRMRKAR